MSRNNEFTANHALAAAAKPVASKYDATRTLFEGVMMMVDSFLLGAPDVTATTVPLHVYTSDNFSRVGGRYQLSSS